MLRRRVEPKQYVSIKYTERLAEAGLVPSVGSVGDSYDNALAETINGLYKAEVIHRRGPWRSLEAVEYATLEWVDWFNNRRLLEPIGNVPPAEAEAQRLREQVVGPLSRIKATHTDSTIEFDDGNSISQLHGPTKACHWSRLRNGTETRTGMARSTASAIRVRKPPPSASVLPNLLTITRSGCAGSAARTSCMALSNWSRTRAHPLASGPRS